MKRLLILLGLVVSGPSFAASCVDTLTLCPSPRYNVMTTNVLTLTTLNLSTLSVSGAVTGAGFTAFMASPPAIGGTAAAAGKFTALTGTGLTISGTAPTGAGITALFATPPPIGSSVANTGQFSTLSATGQITSTLAIGTAPFVITSTTNVANLNSATLNGTTFGSPGPIGNLTPGTATFTGLIASTSATLSPSGVVTINPATIGAMNNMIIGASTPLAATFTGLTATGTVSLSPANLVVTISPSGTGTVVISPVGALTINPTAASTINNASIGVTTPLAGKFTTILATSTITPSSTSGIVGTTTNDSANAGSVGEYITSTVLTGSAVSLSNGTAANVTSVSLTAGDWMCAGNLAYNANGATTVAAASGWVSTVSAAFPTVPNSGSYSTWAQATTVTVPNGMPVLSLSPARFSLAGTTTVFLEGSSSFAANTMSIYGFIGCRRMR